MKILITGGHVTPALALIEELQSEFKNKELEIVFVGRKYPIETERVLSLEYKEITKRGIKFIPLQSGRLTRVLSIRTIRNLLRLPLGFWTAFNIVRSEQPNLVFSFGGYLALPIAIWAFIFQLPVYTHEQTIHPGLANRIIGFFSKKIFLAFAEATKYFNPQKTMVIGNPVRNSIYKISKKPFQLEKDRPVLYITGGSLGSHSINLHIQKLLPRLLNKYIVIHQTGDTKEYQDYENLLLMRKKLPPDLRNRYFPRKHFYEEEIGYIYSAADLVVGRAGANTFFELLVLQKPALFIPLPWSSGGEQEKHAKIFWQNGVGEIFHQLDSNRHLIKLIDKMILKLDDYKKKFHKLNHFYKKNAAKVVVQTITNQN